jgi:hypothetical protein
VVWEVGESVEVVVSPEFHGLGCLRDIGFVAFYVRLFYTEEFLGWNSEEWPHSFFWSLVRTVIPALRLLAVR